jgi:hypothetical protein
MISDSTASASRPKAPLATAIAVHVLMLPWWEVVAALLASGFGDESGDLAAMGWAVFGLVSAIWLSLLVTLVRWWREGRYPLWPYPLRWVLVSSVLWTLVFRRVRRAMAPEKTTR